MRKYFEQGRNGGQALEARAPPAFYTLAKDVSVNRGITHFTFGLR